MFLPAARRRSWVRLPFCSRHDFLPVTDAVVTQPAFAIARWEQPLVVVNLDRAILYAPALE